MFLPSYHEKYLYKSDNFGLFEIFEIQMLALSMLLATELDIMKKSLTTRESTYIELIFHNKNLCPRLKACA